MNRAPRVKSKRLPDAEFAVMECIWSARPPVTTSQVARRVGRARGWKIQTVVSLFARLMERGFLRAEKGEGRQRAYYPCITRAQYLRMETEWFVDRYYHSSYPSLLSALCWERLSPADREAAARWLREEMEGP